MTHTLMADLKLGKMVAFGKEINISCIVRNETNNRRKDEVVKSIPQGKPIQPRTFPLGTWEVGTPVAREDTYLHPFFIPTKAWQLMPIWELDSLGNYKNPTENMTRDSGYGLHFSTSRSTQGCIKIMNKDDLLFLVSKINLAHLAKDIVEINVV